MASCSSSSLIWKSSKRCAVAACCACIFSILFLAATAQRLEDFQIRLEDEQEAIATTRETLQSLNQQLLQTNDELKLVEHDYKLAELDYQQASTHYNENNLQLTRQQSKIAALQQELAFKQKQLNDLYQQIDTNTAQLTEAATIIIEGENGLQDSHEALLVLLRSKEAEAKKLNETDQAFYNLRNTLQAKETELRTKVKSKEMLDGLMNEVKDKFNV